jgi:hypothetical protein
MTNKPEDRYITFHNYLFFFCLECELNWFFVCCIDWV